MLHFKRLHLLNMWYQISLQSPQETPECPWGWTSWLSSVWPVLGTGTYLWSFCLLNADVHWEQKPAAD